MLNPPIGYISDFLNRKDTIWYFDLLRNKLDWERRSDAPRSEYYCNDFPNSYTYGRGDGERTYQPRPYHPVIITIRKQLEEYTGYTYETVFCNYYRNEFDHLGWHSDDSPAMDDSKPIASVSLGQEREIWFRKIPHVCYACNGSGKYDNTGSPTCSSCDGSGKEENKISKLKLESGSLCLMAPGMQDAWQHKIPKVGNKCGERISLVFRGYVNK